MATNPSGADANAGAEDATGGQTRQQQQQQQQQQQSTSAGDDDVIPDCFHRLPLWICIYGWITMILLTLVSVVGLVAAVMAFNNCTEVRVTLYLIVHGSVCLGGVIMVIVELGLPSGFKLTARILSIIKGLHFVLMLIGIFLGLYYINNRYNANFCLFEFYTMSQTLPIIYLVLIAAQSPLLIFYARGILVLRCGSQNEAKTTVVKGKGLPPTGRRSGGSVSPAAADAQAV